MSAERCRVCGAAGGSVTCDQGDVRWVRCPGCGTERHQPYPDDGDADASHVARTGFGHYGYEAHYCEAYRERFERRCALSWDALGIPSEAARGRRWLDVGCTNGQYLEFLARFGVAAEGIDVSTALVEAGTRRGLRCALTGLRRVPHAAYDAVSLFHVLEHVPHPVEFVYELRRVLRDGGWLILETPCTGPLYLPMQHLHLFSEPGLRALLERSGFTISRAVHGQAVAVWALAA